MFFSIGIDCAIPTAFILGAFWRRRELAGVCRRELRAPLVSQFGGLAISRGPSTYVAEFGDQIFVLC